MRKVREMKTIRKYLGKLLRNNQNFSGRYWEKRYWSGGSSGAGSYGRLAQHKADVINDFIEKYNINSVIELGCGDGNQLLYMKYPEYTGFDVSNNVIQKCREKFSTDTHKTFLHISKLDQQKADLTLSLDVIFHLVEDAVFQQHMRQLFQASNRYVIIYSSNHNDNSDTAPHVRHRKFTAWVEQNITDFEFIDRIDNKYPLTSDPENETFSNFYIYRKI